MNPNRNLATAIFGLVLILLGIVFLVGQFIHIDFGFDLWPFGLIFLGGMFFVGMVAGGTSAGGLAIPGSIITMIGLIMLFMSNFGHWEAWSYAWALIIVAVGIGMVIHGQWSNDPHIRNSGWRLVRLGAILFIAFGAFFELIIGFGRYSLYGKVLWPLLLIGLGVYLFVSRLLRRSHHNSNPPQSQEPPAPGQ